jgi:hypothetical protein
VAPYWVTDDQCEDQGFSNLQCTSTLHTVLLLALLQGLVINEFKGSSFELDASGQGYRDGQQVCRGG